MVLYFTYTEKTGRTKATLLKIKYAILQALIFKLHFFITWCFLPNNQNNSLYNV